LQLDGTPIEACATDLCVPNCRDSARRSSGVIDLDPGKYCSVSDDDDDDEVGDREIEEDEVEEVVAVMATIEAGLNEAIIAMVIKVVRVEDLVIIIKLHSGRANC